MSNCSESYNNWSYIFPWRIIFTNSVCTVQCTIQYITSRFHYNRFHWIPNIFCKLIFLWWNASDPHAQSSTLLFIFFTSLEEYFILLLRIFHMLLKNWYNEGARAAFTNFLLNNLFNFSRNSSSNIFLTSSIRLSCNSLNLFSDLRSIKTWILSLGVLTIFNINDMKYVI